MIKKKLLLALAVVVTSLTSTPYVQAMQDLNEFWEVRKICCNLDEKAEIEEQIRQIDKNTEEREKQKIKRQVLEIDEKTRNVEEEEIEEQIRQIDKNTEEREKEEQEELKRVLEQSRKEQERLSTKIERELTLEEKFDSLGMYLLEYDTALDYIQHTHNDINTLEARKALHNVGIFLKDEFTEEGFQKIRKELGKDEPKKKIIENWQVPVREEDPRTTQLIENKQDPKTREFVKSSNEALGQIYHCILQEINNNAKENYKSLELALTLFKESSMSVSFAFEKNRQHFEKLKNVFQKIHGPLTVDFGKASNKVGDVQDVVSRKKGGLFQSWEKLQEWADPKKSWKDIRPFLNDAICMFVQATQGNDQPLKLLIEEQRDACVSGLSGRVLLHLANFLKTQVEEVEQGKRLLKN